MPEPARPPGLLAALGLVACGAAPGALLRWQAEVLLGPLLGSAARADLLVNVLGSFLLGLLAARAPRGGAALLLLGTGFCGAFTTFSTLVLDLARLGVGAGAALLLAASLGLGLAAAALGALLGRSRGA